jgi:hypothetical protein
LISKGIPAKLDSLRADLEARDARDQSRAAAPLKPAQDALLLDNSHLTIEQSVDQVLNWWQERQPFRPPDGLGCPHTRQDHVRTGFLPPASRRAFKRIEPVVFHPNRGSSANPSFRRQSFKRCNRAVVNLRADKETFHV